LGEELLIDMISYLCLITVIPSGIQNNERGCKAKRNYLSAGKTCQLGPRKEKKTKLTLANWDKIVSKYYCGSTIQWQYFYLAGEAEQSDLKAPQLQCYQFWPNSATAPCCFK
jgi:hypothetical protein